MNVKLLLTTLAILALAIVYAMWLSGCATIPYQHPCDPAETAHYGVTMDYGSCLAYRTQCEATGLPSIECFPAG